MPPDLANDQELALKKRARRRLVGAIALVLLMVIVLPQILEDRVVVTKQENIKITMPATEEILIMPESTEKVAAEPPVISPSTETIVETPAIGDLPGAPVEQAQKSAPVDTTVVNQEKPVSPVAAEKAEPTELAGAKKAEVKTESVKSPEPTQQNASKHKSTSDAQKGQVQFTVQIGVYSNLDNLKKAQEQLKQAGFSAYTEKVSGSKGELIRLRTGHFKSRQDAINGQAKLKKAGITGNVVESS